MITSQNKLTEIQLELLKSFKYLSGEREIQEVKSLLNLYFRKKLDTAIEGEENSKNYTAMVYEEWLKENK